jgi:hypothetical protein
MHFIRHAEYVSDYRVRLVFEDGSVRIADLASHLDGEVFEPLKAVERFKTLRVEPDLDTIVWDNGADMSPDFLYEISAESSSAA